MAKTTDFWHRKSVQRPSSHAHDSHPLTPVEKGLGAASILVPFFISLSRLATSGQWRDDLAAVRDAGFVPLGLGGQASTLLTQAMGLVPIGSQAFRAALGSSLCLAVSSALLFLLSRRLFLVSPRFRTRPTILPTLTAAIATLMTALSPSFQRESTVGGGAMTGVTIALALITVTLDSSKERSQAPALRGLVLGCLGGLLAAESLPVFGGVITALFVLVWDERRRSRIFASNSYAKWVLVLSALTTFAGLNASLFLRPAQDRAFGGLGRSLSSAHLAAFDIASARTSAFAAWVHEVGALPLILAAMGAATQLILPTRRGRRPATFALGTLLAVDIVFPAKAAGVLAVDPLTGLRCLSVLVLSILVALAVHEGVHGLLGTRLPLTRASAAMMVSFHLTLAMLVSEEAGFATDRSHRFGADAWTSEALTKLPPSSTVLVRSPALAFRLWAAKLVQGDRPDVAIVPMSLLDRGRIASNLLATDRRFEPMLRDIALTHNPSEYSLSLIADAHPLFAELEASWSRRLIHHLHSAGPWLRYASQPLGPSDRTKSTSSSIASLKRIATTLNQGFRPESVIEASTSAVLHRAVQSQVQVLELLGDEDAAIRLMDEIPEFPTTDAYVVGTPMKQAEPMMSRAVQRIIARRRR